MPRSRRPRPRTRCARSPPTARCRCRCGRCPYEEPRDGARLDVPALGARGRPARDRRDRHGAGRGGRRQRHRPVDPALRRPLRAARRGRPAGSGRPGGAAAGTSRRSAATSASTSRCGSSTPTCCEPARRPCLSGGCAPSVLAPAGCCPRDADEVDPLDPDVLALAADLLATQRAAAGCVGLAAPQVGVPLRVFSLDVSDHPRTRTCHGALVLANPVGGVGDAAGSAAGRAACRCPTSPVTSSEPPGWWSWRWCPGPAPRSRSRPTRFEARALQHEIDHLDGLLFLDRVAGAHALHPRQTYL